MVPCCQGYGRGWQAELSCKLSLSISGAPFFSAYQLINSQAATLEKHFKKMKAAGTFGNNSNSGPAEADGADAEMEG